MTKFFQPDPNKILIVDISKWQDAPNTPKIPDFEIMKSRGVSGVIVKCGEANSIDRAFLSYVDALVKAEMPYGIYWYYNNKYPPKKQAMLFASTLQNGTNSQPLGLVPKLGFWLDLEDRNPGKYIGWKHWYDFLAELKSDFPTELIGIYTGFYYFTEMTISLGISASSLDWFKQFPLWIASYSYNPRVPKPWGDNWTLWQFTDVLDGLQFGVESKELDGNYFNGTMEEYKQFFRLVTTPAKERKLIKTIYVYSDGSEEVIEEK